MSTERDTTIAVQAIDGTFHGLPATVSNERGGTEMTFLEQGVDAEGEYLRVEGRLDVDGQGPPRHVHPFQEERGTVLSGRLIYELGGVERVAIAGESFVVPVGVPHSFRNGGDEPVRFVGEVRPPMAFETFIRTMYDVVGDGVPNPLQVAATAYRFRDDNRLAAVPWVVQKPLLRVGAAIAKRVGIRPTYPEFTPRA